MTRLLAAVLAVVALVTQAQADPNILAAVNQARESKRRAPLVYDDRLEAAARAHALDMADARFFSHTGSDRSNVGTRLHRVGYDWCFAAENIAAGQRSLDRVMAVWMDSRGHRRNILHRKARAVGVARATGNRWVMVLASPCRIETFSGNGKRDGN